MIRANVTWEQLNEIEDIKIKLQQLEKNIYKEIQTSDKNQKDIFLNQVVKIKQNTDCNIFNIKQDVNSIVKRLEDITKKLNVINGYVASNNFKKSIVDQDSLTKFAIDCLSTLTTKATKDLIPVGTKIKNTFDNHIWVFNKLTLEKGLTSYKWEDFGCDAICIANNDGIHGVVTGSQEHFKAFIDINGIITINDLEEEFQDVLKSINQLNTQISDMKLIYDEKILKLESEIQILKEKCQG